MTFVDLLSEWQVPHDGILYIQSSADWLRRAGFDIKEVLETLRTWVGDAGTLAMPAYPYGSTQLEYLQAHPRFDVRRTPTTLGLLAETFRRSARAIRSLDPDFSIVAEGAEAASITAVNAD